MKKILLFSFIGLFLSGPLMAEIQTEQTTTTKSTAKAKHHKKHVKRKRTATNDAPMKLNTDNRNSSAGSVQTSDK